MNRTETLAAIAALPVSDEVKRHASKLIEGLPEWCPMPNLVTDIEFGDDDSSVIVAMLNWVGFRHCLYIHVEDNGGSPSYAYRCIGDGRCSSGERITDRDVWELLRQLTGMVAITGGG